MNPVEKQQRTQVKAVLIFALWCVGVTSFFIMGMRIWDQILLGHTDWCSRALGAAKYATGRPADAVKQCFELQQLQIRTISDGSLIDSITIALCLLVLIVIVVAGGRLSLSAGKDGVRTTIESADDEHPEVEAARRTAAAATEEASQIADEAATRPAAAPAAPQQAAEHKDTEILE